MPRRARSIVKGAVLLVLTVSCLPTPLTAAQNGLQPGLSLNRPANFALPDLVIADWDVILLRPLDTGATRPVPVLELTVKNIGLTKAPASHTHVRFVTRNANGEASGPKSATVLPTSALAPDASVTLRVSIPTPQRGPGIVSFGFGAAADAGPNGLITASEIAERSEANNGLGVTLQTF